MTGRGLGYCAGYAGPGYTKPGFGHRGFGGGGGWGRGFGRGWGRGWGWRHHPYAWGAPVWPAWEWGPGAAPPTQEQEMDYLQAEAEALKEQLDAIQTRIADLEEPSES
jgi:hypothetical protein